MKQLFVGVFLFFGVLVFMTAPTSVSAAKETVKVHDEVLCSFTLHTPFPATLDVLIAEAAMQCPGFPLNFKEFGLKVKQGEYTILTIKSDHQIWYHVPKLIIGYSSNTTPIVVNIDRKDYVKDVVAPMMVGTDPWKGFTLFDECSYLWISTTGNGYWRIDGDKEQCNKSLLGK